MRIVFAGSPEVAAITLTYLLEKTEHEVLAVITRPPAKSGRGLSRSLSPVAHLAEQRGIPVWTPATAQDLVFREALEKLRPDCVPIVGYGVLIPPFLLDLPHHGWVNVHYSLLPAWRGAGPVQAAIASGDEITGVTTFRLEEGLDTGPLWGHATEQIRPTDTTGALLGRLALAGSELLGATLAGLESGDLVARPQDSVGVTYAPKITSHDARIRWELPAHILERSVRAMTPAPGAWTMLNGKRIKCEPLTWPDVHDLSLAPGELLARKNAVYVGTGTEVLQINEVRPEGKGAMPATAWARGARLEPGTSFDIAPTNTGRPG